MPSRHLLAVLLVTLLAGGLLGLWAYRHLERKACLDAGGCWDEVRGRCSEAQDGCSTSP